MRASAHEWLHGDSQSENGRRRDWILLHPLYLDGVVALRGLVDDRRLERAERRGEHDDLHRLRRGHERRRERMAHKLDRRLSLGPALGVASADDLDQPERRSDARSEPRADFRSRQLIRS